MGGNFELDRLAHSSGSAITLEKSTCEQSGDVGTHFRLLAPFFSQGNLGGRALARTAKQNDERSTESTRNHRLSPLPSL